MPFLITKVSENFHFCKRVLVTGGAGFIGGAVIRRLLLETDSLIFNLDKMGYSSDLTSIENLAKTKGDDLQSRHKLLNVDISNPRETLKAIKAADPDLVIHLAAESHVDRSIDDPDSFVSSNVNGTYNLLQASRIHFQSLNPARRKLFRFHHISTDEVFGSLEDNGLFNECSNYSPRSPYSASKAASDHLVNAWHNTYDLPIVITNCSNNFGPWQFPEKLIPLVILKALEGEKIPIYGDGRNVRDWLFVEDHVDAILLVATKGKIGESYCIGGSNEITNLEMVNNICKLLDAKRSNHESSYSDLICFVKDRPGHDHRYAIDSTKISKALSWKPQHDFNSALDKTISWYLDNLDWCRKVQSRSIYQGQRLGLSN